MLGSIYHHKRMVFSDGTIAIKLLILLNNPTKNEPYLCVKTTSQKKNKPSTSGCIRDRALFFIPAGTTFFGKDTWVQLYEIYPFDPYQFPRDSNVSKAGKLDHKVIEKIIDCLFLSQEDDIPPLYRDLIRPPLHVGLQKLKDKFCKKP
jgi:hypothetical protein